MSEYDGLTAGEAAYEAEDKCSKCGSDPDCPLHDTYDGRVCDACLEYYHVCENCGEQGGTPHIEWITDRETGYCEDFEYCSLCHPIRGDV